LTTPGLRHMCGAVGSETQHHEQPSDYVPIPTTGTARPRWLGSAMLFGLLAFAAIFFFIDFDELWRTLAGADLRLLPLPIICVALSYMTMAMSYYGISRAAGWTIPFPEMLKITFVANTLNYIFATGGLSGFAARMYYFTRLSVPSNTAVVISLAQTFMTNVTLLGFIIAGFLYVLATQQLEGSALVITATLLALFFSFAIIAAFLLFNARLRRRTLFRLAQGCYAILHRLQPRWAPKRTHIWRYQFNLNRGIGFMLARKKNMIAPLAYIILDWFFTILILHTAFMTVHYNLPFSYTVVGFAVGITLSFVSLIPGGLGVMEGSMAAIFAGMGVPFETAVLAVLLFRITYYILPLLISLFFLHGMFTQAREATEIQAGSR
jgi:uncharacterized protein (TIRG00374 family)